MNKPLLLRGLVAAMSGSRETTIEETDATKSTKGATSYGKTTMSVQELSAQMGISLPTFIRKKCMNVVMMTSLHRKKQMYHIQ
jgi:hypothetical protein